MDAVTDTEAQARAVERDIEQTRNEMDATLSELERRLAPSAASGLIGRRPFGMIPA